MFERSETSLFWVVARRLEQPEILRSAQNYRTLWAVKYPTPSALSRE